MTTLGGAGTTVRNACQRHPPCSSHQLLLVGSEFPWLLAPALRSLPRPDPLRGVWEGSLRPSDIMAGADICLRQGSIRNLAYLSIGVTSGIGTGLCRVPGDGCFQGYRDGAMQDLGYELPTCLTLLRSLVVCSR